MATDRTNIGNKFEDGDIPSHSDFKEIFDSFVHKDEDKADFQMVETGTDTEHYVTPALLRTGLQNIGIITGNSFMPHKENFEDSFSGTILPLTYFPIPKSVKVFKNGQLLQEGPDYTVNYDTAQIKFLETVTDRNLEVDYWYKNLSPSPGSGSGAAIDFTSFLHTSGNETKNGLLTFNNTAATSTSGIILKNSGTAAGTTSLDVTNSGAGSGISLQNSSTGTGVKVSNAGAGAAVSVNSEPGSTGDILQVSKNNVVTAKIDNEGNVTAKKFVTSGGTDLKFVKGDGSLDPTTYADDTKVIHTEGNESKDGALTLTHDNGLPEDVLTIIKNNSANCLKLVQNSSSNATTSTFDTTTADNNRKAISIKKIAQEKAFITHDGNVSGTSFTTLNEKADITDGFLTLGDSTSPVATANHAKLYAKTDGTTDMYVMGSDGVEKKIGGVVDLSGKENTIAPGTTAQYYRGDKTWQALDKTAVGLANVDNTSDLSKPVSTATQTALNAKQATLVSGTNIKTINGVNLLGSGDIAISGAGATITGTANKLAKFNSTGNNVIDSNITDNGSLVTISKPTIIDSGTNNVSGLRLSKLLENPSTNTYLTGGIGSSSGIVMANNGDFYIISSNSSGTLYKYSAQGVLTTIVTGFGAPNSLCKTDNTDLLVTCNNNLNVLRITTSGLITTFATGNSFDTICKGIDGNYYAADGGITYKITNSGVITTISTTSSSFAATGITQGKDGNLYIVDNSNSRLLKITLSGDVSVLATGLGNAFGISQISDGSFYIANNNGSILNVSLSGTVTIYTTNVTIPVSIYADLNSNVYYTGNSSLYVYTSPSSKVLKTDSNGYVVKTTYLEDAQYLKASDVDLSSYIKTLSPTLTGTPTAPTASLGDNSTQIATTAFVLANTSASNSTSGSFTPALSLSLNNVSGIVIKTANYTKIGNIVTVQYAVNLSIVASSTNSFFEIEAPFTRIGTTISYYVGQGTVYATGLPQGIPGQAYFLSSNQGYIRFLFTSETGFGPRDVTFSCQYDVTK